jgi:iron(III) transport system substrate-binding protein
MPVVAATMRKGRNNEISGGGVMIAHEHARPRTGWLRTALAVVPLLTASPALAAAPAATPVTSDLVAAATKEGRVVFYTSIDLEVATKIVQTFEAKYPGITVQVERNGAERTFQRIAQERESKIYVADILESSDTAQFIVWKRLGWLEPFVPTEVAEKWHADQRDADGCFASVRYTLSPIAYNTKLVKADQAPKSFAELLDKKWSGKIVKAHPGYSGGIVTSTFQTSRDLGWDYFEKLGKQRVLQVQSATEPPKKLALGERPIMADGLEYRLLLMKEKGSPVEIVYPSEGTPFLSGSAAIADKAPHPNAARLLIGFLFSRDTQQFMSDVGGLRSFHPDVTLKEGRKPISEIKLMRSDPETQERETETIKQKYVEYFGT